MTSEGFAPAKINLSLHVTGQRPDGYHLLDSLVAFADIGDRLWIEPADEMSVSVTGPFAVGVPEDRRNLVWRAAELAGGVARITVEKNLPHGAGIGGGSSDAAAVLRHFGVTDGAGRLGADVPVCLRPVAQRMHGIGELLSDVPPLPPLHAVLVNPGLHLPTPTVFARLDTRQNAPMPDEIRSFRDARDCALWLSEQRNDLETPALSVAPEIGEVLKALSASPEALLARMSGSGATCFGLFATATQAQSAAATLASTHPRWWVQPCQIR